MVNDDAEYNKVLDKMHTEVKDGRLMIDVTSLILVNESFASFIMENQQEMNEQSFWAMASVVEMWRGIYDTLSARYAAEMVPDSLEGLELPEEE